MFTFTGEGALKVEVHRKLCSCSCSHAVNKLNRDDCDVGGGCWSSTKKFLTDVFESEGNVAYSKSRAAMEVCPAWFAVQIEMEEGVPDELILLETDGDFLLAGPYYQPHTGLMT